MLTKAAKKLLVVTVDDNILATVSPNPGRGYFEWKTVNGNTIFISHKSYYHYLSFVNSQITESSGQGIAVGSGNTPATEDDYTIEQQIYGNISGSCTNTSIYDPETDSVIFRITVTVTNNRSESIEINEIIRTVQSDTASTKGDIVSGSARRVWLVDRTVLESPVVIAPGESGVIHYDFIMYNGNDELTVKAKKA